MNSQVHKYMYTDKTVISTVSNLDNYIQFLSVCIFLSTYITLKCLVNDKKNIYTTFLIKKFSLNIPF